LRFSQRLLLRRVPPELVDDPLILRLHGKQRVARRVGLGEGDLAARSSRRHGRR